MTTTTTEATPEVATDKPTWYTGGALTGNKILKQPDADWYISYAEAPFMGKGPETALSWMDGESNKWYILDGDWTAQYEAAFPDLEACKKIYLDNKEEHRNSWSVD